MTTPQATQSSGPLATLKMAQGNWPDHENAGKKATVAHDFCIFLYISVNFCIFMYIYVSYSIVCMYYPHDDWKKTRVHPWMRTAFRGFHISNWDWSRSGRFILGNNQGINIRFLELSVPDHDPSAWSFEGTSRSIKRLRDVSVLQL